MKLYPGEKKLMTAGVIGLGAVVLTILICDRDRHRERAHCLSMAGRGTYR